MAHTLTLKSLPNFLKSIKKSTFWPIKQMERVVVDEALQFTILRYWQLGAVHQVDTIDNDLALKSSSYTNTQTFKTYRMRWTNVEALFFNFFRHPSLNEKINQDWRIARRVANKFQTTQYPLSAQRKLVGCVPKMLFIQRDQRKNGSDMAWRLIEMKEQKHRPPPQPNKANYRQQLTLLRSSPGARRARMKTTVVRPPIRQVFFCPNPRSGFTHLPHEHMHSFWSKLHARDHMLFQHVSKQRIKSFGGLGSKPLLPINIQIISRTKEVKLSFIFLTWIALESVAVYKL